MKIDWAVLTAELALWRAQGLHLPLWWRDDDAVKATPALERLSVLAADLGMPVYIAVIPDLVEPTLAPAVNAHPDVIPIVHGWRHISHAPKGVKNAEFGHPRAGARWELADGLRHLQQTFETALVPLFVPPWNRIDDSLLAVLEDVGYGGVSTFGARRSACHVGTLAQINTHIDPIFWRGHRGLVDPDELVKKITRTLEARRTGEDDATEPLGLLTHHLVHTEDVWAFSREMLVVLLDGGAVPVDIGRLIQAGRKPSI